MSGDSEGQQTDFDSLFILNEEDKADLVAKQQQLSYIRRGEGGSGAGSPARGSPARRTQVSQWCSHAAVHYGKPGRHYNNVLYRGLLYTIPDSWFEK